ncbi:gliding motility-associated C-terminal domain-containing protein [Fluviicola sp.]|uniref:T9SS type B sorting domain-containing protein n=1 Tax=Fluviicola sp. TaxID=1917219 RepID=UPI0031CEDBE3
MSKFVLHIVFLFTLFFAIGQQNLVPNGSFEEYNWCPSTSSGYYLNACKYWNSPTLGSPDYFNACSTEFDIVLQRFLYSVPQNYAGDQPAHSGNACGFFGFGQNEVGSTPYAEYLQIKLTQTLQSGRFYTVRFFINNAGHSCINSVSALFTSQELNLNTDSLIPLSPQITSDSTIFFCDTINWQEVTGVFQAVGNENYLTIGVFKKTPQLLVSDLQGNSTPSFYSAYLYIDDVSVTEKEFEIPNIFTPNGDGVNDHYIIDLEALGATGAEIYNRWGNCVARGEKFLYWDGKFDGKECNNGVYYLRLQLENNIVNGFIHLMK